MKYIIKESKINDLVINFLNQMYDVDKMNYHHPYDTFVENGEWVEGENSDLCDFYIGDYNENEGLFRWYGKGYWTGQNEIGDRRRNESPILSFMNDDEYDILQGMFGENWKPAFKMWFENNFNYPVKTVRS